MTHTKKLIVLGLAALAAVVGGVQPASATTTIGHVAVLQAQRNTANYIYAVAGEAVMTKDTDSLGVIVVEAACAATREPVNTSSTSPMWMECFIRNQFGWEEHFTGPGVGNQYGAADSGVRTVSDWGYEWEFCTRVYGAQLSGGWETCTGFFA